VSILSKIKTILGLTAQEKSSTNPPSDPPKDRAAEPRQSNHRQRSGNREQGSNRHRGPYHDHRRKKDAPKPQDKKPQAKMPEEKKLEEKKTEEKKQPPKPEAPRKLFSELGLEKKLLELLALHEFKTATKVQEESIPVALKGGNIFCSSETGSGKTLSFLLPMIQKFHEGKIHQALIVCPTREIAIQTEKVLQMFTDDSLTSALVIGGTNMEAQRQSLRAFPNILVATPGRLLDMLSTGLIWLAHTEYVVLDEADRMLDMGFEEDLIKIHNELSGKHQTLLFSATLFPEIKKMAKRYASDYVEVTIGSPRSIAGSVEHVLVEMDTNEKLSALEFMIRQNRGKMIVFFNRIKDIDETLKKLRDRRVRGVNCIHSKRNQETREQLIADFRERHFSILLASDVAARGVDIPNVELVVNYDLPNNCEEYIHRVGRTGRAGQSGKAISFYSPRDSKNLMAIEKLIKDKIKRTKNYKDLFGQSRPQSSRSRPRS
jgi:ATP-dependent RNA helicase RhlE